MKWYSASALIWYKTAKGFEYVLKCSGESSIKVFSTTSQCWDKSRNCWHLSFITEENGDCPQARTCGDTSNCSLFRVGLEHLRSFQPLLTRYSDYLLHPFGLTVINVHLTCSVPATFSLPVFVKVVLFFSLAFTRTEKCLF